jgi:superfamily II DNA helicase RecQ
MAPETAVSSVWRELFSVSMFKQHLAVVAIDEAHCITEWLDQNTCLHSVCTPYAYHLILPRGGDFRTCFRKLARLRGLTDVLFMALTATAPPGIKATICASLGLKEPVVVSQTLDRPNIYLSIRESKGINVSIPTRCLTMDVL